MGCLVDARGVKGRGSVLEKVCVHFKLLDYDNSNLRMSRIQMLAIFLPIEI